MLHHAVTAAAVTKRCCSHLTTAAYGTNSWDSRAEGSKWGHAGCIRNAGLGNVNLLVVSRTFEKKSATSTSSFSSTSAKRFFSKTTGAGTPGQDFSTEEHSRAVEEWLTQVANMVSSLPEVDVFSVEGSMINIMLRHSASGGLFDMEDAADAYRYVSMDVSGAVPRSANPDERSALAVVCNFGPPVDVDTHAVLSIALEPDSLANYLEDAEGILEKDKAAIKKLSLVAKYFESIKRSNA
jgi:hypothetical protein